MMAENHSWQEPKSPVTDELVHQVASIIVKGIQNSPDGIFTASITAIREANGETDPEEYGTYLHAVANACRKYGITWEKAGKRGRRYAMSQAAMAAFLAQQAIQTGRYDTTIQVTLTCPHCNAPTTYSVKISPVSKEG